MRSILSEYPSKKRQTFISRVFPPVVLPSPQGREGTKVPWRPGCDAPCLAPWQKSEVSIHLPKKLDVTNMTNVEGSKTKRWNQILYKKSWSLFFPISERIELYWKNVVCFNLRDQPKGRPCKGGGEANAKNISWCLMFFLTPKKSPGRLQGVHDFFEWVKIVGKSHGQVWLIDASYHRG